MSTQISIHVYTHVCKSVLTHAYPRVYTPVSTQARKALEGAREQTEVLVAELERSSARCCELEHELESQRAWSLPGAEQSLYMESHKKKTEMLVSELEQATMA